MAGSPYSPRMLGPSSPPRLPTELIRAMPPAAAAPLRNAVGSAQKIGSMLIMPAWARHRPARNSHGDGGPARSSAQPAAARKAAKATWPRRSPVRSECDAEQGHAQRWRTGGGRAASRPISSLLEPRKAVLDELREVGAGGVRADRDGEVQADQQPDPRRRPAPAAGRYRAAARRCVLLLAQPLRRARSRSSAVSQRACSGRPVRTARARRCRAAPRGCPRAGTATASPSGRRRRPGIA